MKKTKILSGKVQKNECYILPEYLISNKKFKDLSFIAKTLYCVMCKKQNISIQNNWIDDDGYIYIIYSRELMMKDLQVSKPTIIKAINELKEYNLIDEFQQGFGKANLIYVLGL